jgi:hypothetical protein
MPAQSRRFSNRPECRGACSHERVEGRARARLLCRTRRSVADRPARKPRGCLRQSGRSLAGMADGRPGSGLPGSRPGWPVRRGRLGTWRGGCRGKLLEGMRRTSPGFLPNECPTRPRCFRRTRPVASSVFGPRHCSRLVRTGRPDQRRPSFREMRYPDGVQVEEVAVLLGEDEQRLPGTRQPVGDGVRHGVGLLPNKSCSGAASRLILGRAPVVLARAAGSCVEIPRVRACCRCRLR